MFKAVRAPDPDRASGGIPRAARPPDLAWTFLFGLFLFLVYSINFRAPFTNDTLPTNFLAVAMIRGEGPFLERYSRFLPGEPAPGEDLPRNVARAHGHVVSRYPVAPAVAALPFVFPQVLVLDRVRPGWDQDPKRALSYCAWMAKFAAAAITALTGAVLHRVLCALGLTRVAFPAALGGALGTDLWPVASQDMWQHGPAALALSVVIWLVLSGRGAPARLFLAGLAAASLVAFRSVDVIFAAAIFFCLLRHRPRDLGWFLPMPIVLGGVLLAYNVWFFGSVLGGVAQLEAENPLHGGAGAFSGNLLEGAAGTLFSPSRGLFVFSPWILVSLISLPAYAVTIRAWPIVRWLLWALIPYFLVLSKYAVWWAGWSFGPRYWIDAIPVFTVLLGFGLEWAWTRCRGALLGFIPALAVSIVIQVLGAFCYDGSWDREPVNVDHHRERLWDWRDSVIARCLTASPQ
jgi:hypothetical protein